MRESYEVVCYLCPGAVAPSPLAGRAGVPVVVARPWVVKLCPGIWADHYLREHWTPPSLLRETVDNP